MLQTLHVQVIFLFSTRCQSNYIKPVILKYSEIPKLSIKFLSPKHMLMGFWML